MVFAWDVASPRDKVVLTKPDKCTVIKRNSGILAN